MTEPVFPEFDYNNADWADRQVSDEFVALNLTAQKRAINDKLTQYYKRMIDEEQYMEFSYQATPALKKLHTLKQKCDNIADVKQGTNPYCFYTVNLRPEFDNKIEEIEKDLKEFCDKCKYLRDSQYCYSIEQRSEDDDTKGLHMHILFDKGVNAPSKLQRAFKNKFFDKYVGSNACLDYKYITEQMFANKLKYILGVKKPEKMAKVFQDRRLREEKGIQHYYNNGYSSSINDIIKEHNLPFKNAVHQK